MSAIRPRWCSKAGGRSCASRRSPTSWSPSSSRDHARASRDGRPVGPLLHARRHGAARGVVRVSWLRAAGRPVPGNAAAPRHGRRRLVAPEGLSRFYLSERATERRVGASWMTREDRLAEIADYLGYLDAVYDDVF